MKKQETSQEFFYKTGANGVCRIHFPHTVVTKSAKLFACKAGRSCSPANDECPQPDMSEMSMSSLEFSECPGASKSEKWQAPHLAGHLGKLPADDGMLDQLLPDRWVMSHRKLLGLSDKRKMQKT